MTSSVFALFIILKKNDLIILIFHWALFRSVASCCLHTHDSSIDWVYLCVCACVLKKISHMLYVRLYSLIFFSSSSLVLEKKMPKQTRNKELWLPMAFIETHLDRNQNAKLWRVQPNDAACSLFHSVPYGMTSAAAPTLSGCDRI